LRLAGDDVQVVDDRGPAQIVRVLALTAVAGATTLPTTDVGEGVLDGDALAQPVPAPRASAAEHAARPAASRSHLPPGDYLTAF